MRTTTTTTTTSNANASTASNANDAKSRKRQHSIFELSTPPTASDVDADDDDDSDVVPVNASDSWIEQAWALARVQVHSAVERGWFAHRLNLKYHYMRVFTSLFNSWELTLRAYDERQTRTPSTPFTGALIERLIMSIMGPTFQALPKPFKDDFTLPKRAKITPVQVNQPDFIRILNKAHTEALSNMERKWLAAKLRYDSRFMLLVRAVTLKWSDFLLSSLPSNIGNGHFNAAIVVNDLFRSIHVPTTRRVVKEELDIEEDLKCGEAMPPLSPITVEQESRAIKVMNLSMQIKSMNDPILPLTPPTGWE